MTKAEKRRQWELRSVYQNGWDILWAWGQCVCPPGTCPLQAELDRVEVDPGDLLMALALGQPSLIGIV